MKIIHLPALGRAVFKEEATEPFVGGKILVSVENTDGSSLPAAIYLCGSRINISGARDGIYDGAVREGAHPLTVEIGGIRYPVGSATRAGNKVTFKSSDTYSTFVQAAVLADGDEIIFRFTGGIVGPVAPDIGPGGEELPAAACVLYMADHFLPVQFHHGDKPVGAADESGFQHVLVAHFGLR